MSLPDITKKEDNPAFVGLCLVHVLEKFKNFGPFKHINEDYFNEVISLLEGVPLSVSDYFGYEFHLQETKLEPDFLICFHSPIQFRNFLFPFQNKIWKHPKNIQSLDSLIKFQTNWEIKWKSTIQNIWLEFDKNDIQKIDPSFSFFYAPNLKANKLEIVLATKEIFETVTNQSIQSDSLKKLLECYKILGEQAIISQIGMMHARGESGLRLFIQKLGPNNIPLFLKSIGYKYVQEGTLMNILSLSAQFASQVDLDIDIREEILDKIGIECYFTDPQKAIHFFNQFQDLFNCQNEFSSNLVHSYFLNQHHVSNDFKIWFSHFKVTYLPNFPPKLKAYLGFKKQ